MLTENVGEMKVHAPMTRVAPRLSTSYTNDPFQCCRFDPPSPLKLGLQHLNLHVAPSVCEFIYMRVVILSQKTSFPERSFPASL